jgi:hypothetical protein
LLVRIVVQLHDASYKFVAQHPHKAHVALHDFQIGVADSGAEDSNEGVVGRGNGGEGKCAECAVGEWIGVGGVVVGMDDESLHGGG